MAFGTIPCFVGRSGLSENDLSSLWERLGEKWPVAYDALRGSASNLDLEEQASWDAPIYDVIREKYPDLPTYPDCFHVYWDLKHLQGWERVRAVIVRGRILDERDYWAARNSRVAFAGQLSLSDLSHLQQLVRGYEQEG
jgi:hypothetical protein